MLEFCSQKHEFGKPNGITFKAHYTKFVPKNNLSLQDTKELNKIDVSTPKVKHIRSVNDSYISCKDNDAFPTKNRTTTHVRQITQFQICLGRKCSKEQINQECSFYCCGDGCGGRSGKERWWGILDGCGLVRLVIVNMLIGKVSEILVRLRCTDG